LRLSGRHGGCAGRAGAEQGAGGQPQAGTFQFVPLQVGIETGIFRKHGIEVGCQASAAARGSSRRSRRIRSISGSARDRNWRSAAKGAPEIGVAAMADAPYSVLLAVLKDSPIKSGRRPQGQDHQRLQQGLRHLLAGPGAVGALGGGWGEGQGWGPRVSRSRRSARPAPRPAALKTRQIDGMIVEANADTGWRRKAAAAWWSSSATSSVFHIYVIYARKGFAAGVRKAVRAFVAGLVRSASPICTRIGRRRSTSCAAAPRSLSRSRRATMMS